MILRDCQAGMIVKSLKVCDGLDMLSLESYKYHIRTCHLHSLLQIVRVLRTTSKVMVTGCQVREQFRLKEARVPFDSAIVINPGELMRAPEGR